MPVHKVAGGWRWGTHGKVYKDRAGAERQARAIYASGYRGDAGRRMDAARARRTGGRYDSADGKTHLPYMVLPHGGTGPFSCANCEYHVEDEGLHRCSNAEYQAFAGTSLLLDEAGAPLDDPTRACSDWFEP